MSAETLNDRYARNADNLAGEIYKTSLVTDHWHRLVPKGEWQNGISDRQEVLTVERNLAPNIDDWTNVASPNDGTNNCALVAEKVGRGYSKRIFELEQKAIESDPICVNDTRNAFERQEQTKIAFQILRDNVKYAWRRKTMLDYTDIAQHKVIAAPGLPENPSSFPGIEADSLLTTGILNKFYVYLLQNSAAVDGGSLGYVNNAPQFILITEMETSDRIMRESENFTAFAESNRVPELLQPLGVDRSVRGFYHMIDLLPRRYTFSGGTWTEVLPYVETPADTGTKQDLNPAYIGAPYTDSYIFLPNVMSFLHPKPITTVGSMTKFEPQKYAGEFKWCNEVLHDQTSPKYNPDGDIGFYRAKLMCATKPIHPEYGVVIRHLRCAHDIGAQACPDSVAGNPGDLGSGDVFFLP